MLHFFRTYERYFYAVITVVIVITFSFFGTYNEIASTAWRDEPAFQAVDGSKISRTDLQNMVHFISTDGEDKLLFGGSWGPNFLNNGVIKQDFLQTGLAEVLVQHYQKDLNEELQRKLEKEKRYALYTHPQAKFLGMDSVWTHLAPDVKSSFDLLRLSNQATDSDSFSSRVQLYLGERKLPASIVRNVLRYQERQYNWVTPDPNLERIDLSLFGYHTAEDWFGSRFIHLVSQFIINSAKVAEERGYKVTKNEALADLIRQSEKSFQENRTSPYIGLASSREYFKEQLRRMNMDQNSAAQIWRQVLLFRRLFHDMGNSAFIDPATVEQVYQYDNESVRGDIYQLPPSLQFNDWRSLQKFEAYLEAVAKDSKDQKDLLSLPGQYKTAAEVSKMHPELVQKRYLVEIAEIDKKALQSSIGIKETWNWEVADANWIKLQKQFPELSLKPLGNKEERFAALDELDPKTRNRVDSFARAQILEEDASRLAKALEDAKSKKTTLNIQKKGSNPLISGLKNPQELIDLLDQAPLVGQETPPNPQSLEIAEKLKQYSANGSNFYRISVLERAPAEEIMTFEEASQAGTLNEILKRLLEAHYLAIRENNPADFQNEDKAWKEFSAVQGKVAEQYFASLLSAISEDYRKNRPQESSQVIQNLTPELSAPLRFYAHLRNAHQTALKNPAKLNEYIAESSSSTPKSLKAASNLNNQWKLSKEGFTIDRDRTSSMISRDKAIKMSPGDWSAVQPLPNGDIFFFSVTDKGLNQEDESFKNHLIAAKQMLSDEAQRMLMKKLLEEFAEKKAISFDYLSRKGDEEIEPEIPASSD